MIRDCALNFTISTQVAILCGIQVMIQVSTIIIYIIHRRVTRSDHGISSIGSRKKKVLNLPLEPEVLRDPSGFCDPYRPGFDNPATSHDRQGTAADSAGGCTLMVPRSSNRREGY